MGSYASARLALPEGGRRSERLASAPLLPSWATAPPTLMRNVAPITDENRKAVEALAALAQESRLAIFRLLVEQGPEGLAAGEIAERLALPGATLSFHLKELTHAQLVTARQAGRFIYYSANYQAMNGLIDYLTRNCCRSATFDVACAPAAPRKRRAS